MCGFGLIKYRIYLGNRENASGIVQRIPDECVIGVAVGKVSVVSEQGRGSTRACSFRGEGVETVRQEI